MGDHRPSIGYTRPVAAEVHQSRRIRWPLSALGASVLAVASTGCDPQPDPAGERLRPPIETVEQRVCVGRPLPLTHIDEIVPAPDGRLALVGRRTAPVADGVGVETVAWVVAVIDPQASDPLDGMRLIERTDPADRPTPIAWRDETLLVTVGRDRLVPADDPDGPAVRAPFGVPAVFDPDTPHLTVGERSIMILGERSPRGEILRHFVEVEAGDPAAGTVDRIVATYGTLRSDHFSFGFDEEMVGRFVEAVAITDWHVSPDGVFIAMGWVQAFVAPFDFYYRGTRATVESDPEAGWFTEGALEQGGGRIRTNSLGERIAYDLRGDAEGRAQLVYHDRGGPSTTPFNSIADPTGRTVYDYPPPFADRVQVTTIESIGDDRLLAGAGCVDPPYDDTLFETARCRPFISRYVGESEAVRWTVTVDVDDVDHVLDVRPVDGRLVALAAAYDVPHGRGSALAPARLVVLDRAGHCLDE